MEIETVLTQRKIDEYTAKGFWGDKTVGEYLDESIKRYPKKTAVVDSEGKRLTYEELGAKADRVALGFLQSGIKKGDIVSVQLPNSIEVPVLFYALSRIGAIFNSINATYRHSEIEYILNFCESKAIIIPDEFRRFDYVKMIQELQPKLSHLQFIYVVGENVPKEMISFQEFTERHWEKELSSAISGKSKPSANDVLGILFTSGTEAQPKGVLHTHNTILFGEKSFAQALELSGEDVCFMPSPLTHATGFSHGMVLPMILGQKAVSLAIWEPEEALKLIEKERCTYSMGATPFLRTLFDSPNFKKYDISSMKFFLCGGAPVPKELVLEGAKIGLKVLPVYGLTESIPHICGRPNDPPEKAYGLDGRPCPSIEVSIRGENHEALPVGETGEEASRGPNVFVGYFKRPDLNAKSFDDEGWFYSGDLARMDKEGNVIIEGRKKDIIIRGGQNISVKEVEDILLTHPKIYNIAIVAMPDRKMGEKACAFIIPKPRQSVSLEEVTSFLKERKLAMFKLPERIEIVESFPMTASGKIQKYVLRDQIAQKMEAEGKKS